MTRKVHFSGCSESLRPASYDFKRVSYTWGKMGDACVKSPADPLIVFLVQQLGARKGRRLALAHTYRRCNSKEPCASGEVHLVIVARHRRGDRAAFTALSIEADLCSRPRPPVRVPTFLPIRARRSRP
jgi:hypothetical protein